MLGPFIAGAGVFIALGLFDIGSALRELRRRAREGSIRRGSDFSLATGAKGEKEKEASDGHVHG